MHEPLVVPIVPWNYLYASNTCEWNEPYFGTYGPIEAELIKKRTKRQQNLLFDITGKLTLNHISSLCIFFAWEEGTGQ